MATLRVCELADDMPAHSSIPLREWLDGRWAILFSHPDDFVRCELELDRWLGIAGSAFQHARIRPIALARRTCPIDQGWVSQLSGDHCLVSLHERWNGRALLDFPSSRLRACIDSIDERFAMVIDPTLRQRRTWMYGAADQPPSPLDLVRLACRLRNEPMHERTSTPKQESTASSRPKWQGRSLGSYALA